MCKNENIKKEIIDETYKKYQIQFDVYLDKVSLDKRDNEKNRIVSDLLFVIESSDFSASEYFMYDFAHKTRVEQSTFLHEKTTLEMFYRLNEKDKLGYNTRNKWDVYTHLKKYYRREICVVTGIDGKERFFSLLKDKHKLFCKPLCGSLGDKTKIISEKNYTTDEAFQELLDYYGPEGFLAEELIKQSDFMMRLNPTSVNTLRIMTIRMDNRICMYFESRIGEMFSIVDNLNWKSLICGINENDGTIISAFNKNRTPYNLHPQTGAKIVGEKIPYFSQAIELAKELARYFPSFRYLAWDLALTDEGWVIVELNGKGGICGFQEVYNCGIRKDIECYLSELNQPLEFKGLINDGYTPFVSGEMCPHLEQPFIL